MDHPQVFAASAPTGSMTAVVIMARAPVAGRTKTRLEPLLGAPGCARLQAELVRQTAATAAAFAPGAVTVAAAGDVALLAPLVPAGVGIFPQCGGDLGARMAAACRFVRGGRPGRVIVIGTDCPALDGAHLAAAVARLRGGCDVVFGPAHDGGYYLVAHAVAEPAALFALPSTAWGGPDVLRRSLAAAAAAGLTAGLLDHEHDLDTPADAETLRTDPRVPARIAAMLDPVAAR